MQKYVSLPVILSCLSTHPAQAVSNQDVDQAGGSYYELQDDLPTMEEQISILDRLIATTQARIDIYSTQMEQPGVLARVAGLEAKIALYEARKQFLKSQQVVNQPQASIIQ